MWSQTKHRRGLRLRIAMNGVWIIVRFVIEQAIQDIDRLVDATRYKPAEQRNIGVRDQPFQGELHALS